MKIVRKSKVWREEVLRFSVAPGKTWKFASKSFINAKTCQKNNVESNHIRMIQKWYDFCHIKF